MSLLIEFHILAPPSTPAILHISQLEVSGLLTPLHFTSLQSKKQAGAPPSLLILATPSDIQRGPPARTEAREPFAGRARSAGGPSPSPPFSTHPPGALYLPLGLCNLLNHLLAERCWSCFRAVWIKG